MTACWRRPCAGVRHGDTRRGMHRLSTAATSCTCSPGRRNGSSAGSIGNRSGDFERKLRRPGVSQSCPEASTASSTAEGTKVQIFSNHAGLRWRKRVRVERTDDISPPVLKITKWFLIGYENSLLYSILCALSRSGVLMGFCFVLIRLGYGSITFLSRQSPGRH